jgi:ferredoxin
MATYLVDDKCIKCKHLDCVEVCPVDCFYEGENMLVINPDECIDCGVCEPECPVDAIWPDTDPTKKDVLDHWFNFNTEYSQDHKWPVITKNRGPLPEAEEYHPDNFPEGKKHLFDPTPGKGDE